MAGGSGEVCVVVECGGVLHVAERADDERYLSPPAWVATSEARQSAASCLRMGRGRGAGGGDTHLQSVGIAQVVRPAQVQHRAEVGVERGLDGGVRGEVDVQGLALALRTDLACVGRGGKGGEEGRQQHVTKQREGP